MYKKYLLWGSILLFFFAAWGVYQFNKPHSNVAGKTAIATLQAVDLYNAYQKEEASANKKFLGQVIAVRGVVSTVQKTTGTTAILLDVSPMGGVNCSFSTRDSPSPSIRKGDTITIKGRCTGFLMDVNLADCVMEQ